MKEVIARAGAVRIILIIVGLASGNALAISPRAGETAAPAITTAMKIEIMLAPNT
ncbi:MAG: hypothetical protein GX318_02055 [Clostridia bacterium]|nr:hypothetical protein [Clostridia bacterium]